MNTMDNDLQMNKLLQDKNQGWKERHPVPQTFGSQALQIGKPCNQGLELRTTPHFPIPRERPVALPTYVILPTVLSPQISGRVC